MLNLCPGDKLEGLHLESDVEEELLVLQRKGIDVNQVLRELLENRRLEIVQEKEGLSPEIAQAAEQNGGVSRTIPVKIRWHLEKEYGKKCFIEHCGRAAAVIHHTQRFALSRRHDPKYLAPLCKEHHAIAHAIDERVRVRRGSG